MMKMKTSAIIFTIIVISIFVVVYSIKEEDVPALKIKLSVNETHITNATFEQVNVTMFYNKVDSKAEFPEVNAQARLNNIQSEPISYWASVNTPNEGSFEMTMVFRKVPEHNDTLIIPLRYIDFTGRVIHKTTAMYDWK